MTRFFVRMVLIAALLCASGCSRSAAPDPSALAARVDELADALFDTRLALQPELGTMIGLPGADADSTRHETFQYRLVRELAG